MDVLLLWLEFFVVRGISPLDGSDALCHKWPKCLLTLSYGNHDPWHLRWLKGPHI